MNKDIITLALKCESKMFKNIMVTSEALDEDKFELNILSNKEIVLELLKINTNLF